MSASHIRAILVNYNGYQDTIECLHSLKAQTGVDCTPLVVDNASQNGSAAHIRAAYPDVEMVETKRNLGFAGGNNVGIKQALAQGCDFLFLVNNDTTLEPDCVRLLAAAAAARPDAAIVVPAMYYYADKTKPWFTGSTFDAESINTDHLYTDVRGTGAAPYQIPWATGCAMLIPAARMRALQGFDERYFLYWEDVDLSWRAQRDGGLCLLCPEAVLYHKVSASVARTSSRPRYYWSRNKLLFIRGNMAHRPHSLFFYAKSLLQQAKHQYRFAADTADRKNAVAQAVGVLDFAAGRFGRCRHSWLL